jgi:hypothetical protein
VIQIHLNIKEDWTKVQSFFILNTAIRWLKKVRSIVWDEKSSGLVPAIALEF